MKNQFKQDKGTAGLTILLSVIVMLFIIGLITMIFSLMGASLKTATYDTTTNSVVNETLTTVAEAGENLAYSGYRDVACSVGIVTNATDGEIIPSANYTVTNCNLAYSGVAGAFNDTNWNVSYSYTYEADNTATGVMNDTVSGISGATDWFDIFIVISAMLVLILLTVIIITAIRSSGMVGGDGGQGANSVGTA